VCEWLGWLQVEHPVTEWLSGVNLPACQVMIGMGVPLHSIPEIVSLFKVPDGQQRVNFDKDPQVRALMPSCAVADSARHRCAVRSCVKAFFYLQYQKHPNDKPCKLTARRV
jgi:hypothetical protein